MPLHLRLLLPALTLALGTSLGFIAPTGLLFGGLFVVWVLAAERHLPNGLWLALILLSSVSLAAHLIPGFTPWQLWPPRLISSDAAPYGLRLSWDKLLVATTLLAWWLGQARRDANSPQRAWLACIATLLLVPLLAMALGLLAWQPKWPQGLLLWLAINLGVAVLAEELLFRGLLQPALIRYLGTWPGLLLTAGLFGAAHLPFSPLFAIVAACAGLGYGLAFHYSGRLSLAIALHGAVNLLHFLLLSYPLRLT
ncbi:CPBP family intramembrane glutamic endopeptidase [Pseudomonas wenzhouensis]|uniref:CPBP family intramembrane glutamic endopeptidase n=1 Tax=Pseudomonas wenzhouensis TaxID=2906062 RepID=UPI001E356470|nr:CPBP family intramembrane glutamic endopeptidase [Pseudomonas wenzhouensis]UFQ96124.1 CPBP family intramembrane metalloprotease [Pseudomonas wenzhouensis]